MRKIYVCLLTLLCICGTFDNTYAKEQVNSTAYTQVQIPGNISKFVNRYIKATNEHNINEISKIYAQTYISGDGLKRDDVLKLMKDTWENYPDIAVNSIIKDIRVNDEFAAVETFDKTVGHSSKKSDITNDAGILESESHNVIYLQKFGKDWKIISDKAIYEKTTIKFGSAKSLKVNFYAPEQVLAGENYTASLTAEVPNGMIALGSIANEPIVYPETKPEEVYRQINPDTGNLERLMKANTTNNNELATASVGYTEMTEDVLANPEMRLTGLVIVLTRVNVIPKSTFEFQDNKLKIEPDLETNISPDKSDNKDSEK